MSTSLLYHCFGVREYRYVKTKYLAGTTVITIERKQKTDCCAACGSNNVTRQSNVIRQFRTLSIGNRPVILIANIPRVRCNDCGKIRQVPIGFARHRRTYTKSFERCVLELSRSMTIKDVANHLQVSWDIIKDIQKRNLNKHFAKPKLKHLKQIAAEFIEQ